MCRLIFLHDSLVSFTPCSDDKVENLLLDMRIREEMKFMDKITKKRKKWRKNINEYQSLK